MALPELVQRQCERELTELADRRVPVPVRHQVRLEFRFRGNDVVLVERRPPWRGDRAEWTSSKVARFKYQPTERRWSLFWPDRNGRWHPYEGFGEVATFREVVSEVDTDLTGIFWG